MSHNMPFKSPTQVVNPGAAAADFYDFVPLVGPKGGRIVVDKFILVVTGTITVATALWNGADVPRLVGLVNVEQRDGRLRYSLSGYKMRIASILYQGIERHQEHGNVAIGAAQAVDLRLVLPMAKPKLRRGDDYALPADIFRKISVNWNALANAQTGTTALSAASLTAYVLAEWHEEGTAQNPVIELKCEDVVRSVDFNSNTQVRMALNGVVHDLMVVKEGTTAGGDVITAITDARIEDLGTPTLTRQDLLHSYRVKRGLGASGPTTPATERFLDPFISGMALPVLIADDTTSPWDGRILDAMKLDVGTGTTGLSVVTREVVDKSQANYNAVSAKFGITAANWAQKSADGSQRAMADFNGRQQKVGAWKAKLGARAA